MCTRDPSGGSPRRAPRIRPFCGRVRRPARAARRARRGARPGPFQPGRAPRRAAAGGCPRLANRGQLESAEGGGAARLAQQRSCSGGGRARGRLAGSLRAFRQVLRGRSNHGSRRFGSFMSVGSRVAICNRPDSDFGQPSGPISPGAAARQLRLLAVLGPTCPCGGDLSRDRPAARANPGFGASRPGRRAYTISGSWRALRADRSTLRACDPR